MVEEDARSEVSFQSADDEDDFDLPQDVCAAAARKASAEGGGDDDELPPGFDGNEGNDIERWSLRKDGNKEQMEPIWQRLSAEREHVKISKMFSYVLRHAAHKLDVRIRKDGFVRLREIMKLRNFKPYNLEELMAVVYFDEKERHTMVRDMDGELLIRANQGHTMKVVESDLLLEQITEDMDAGEAVHGTYLVHWPFIKRQGLSKVARNHIHLANGLPEDGKIRGMRSTAELFIYVDIQAAIADGIIFYRSKNEVILTQGADGWLPPKYFSKVVRIDYNTCDIEELEFDADIGMPTWAAELAPSGPGEQGTYLIKNLEALISNCKKRLHEINELKQRLDSGEEPPTEEDEEKLANHAQIYSELQSLEQRFRQHKGHRRESAGEREQRVKDEAEISTVVAKKDRAMTPPWERGKTNLESVGSQKVSEKEKAEWAALGARRDKAQSEPQPKRERDPRDSAPPKKTEDPWAALGRGRMEGGATPAATPSNSRPKDDEEPKRFAFGSKFGREDSKEDLRGGAATGKSTASNRDGPPKFFNSKTPTGGSWRDRMAGTGSSNSLGGDAEPSWRGGEAPKTQASRPQPSQRAEEPEFQPEPKQATAVLSTPSSGAGQRPVPSPMEDLSAGEKMELLRREIGGQPSPQPSPQGMAQTPGMANSMGGCGGMQMSAGVQPFTPMQQQVAQPGMQPGMQGMQMGGQGMYGYGQQGGMYYMPQTPQGQDGSMGWMQQQQMPQQFMATSPQGSQQQMPNMQQQQQQQQQQQMQMQMQQQQQMQQQRPQQQQPPQPPAPPTPQMQTPNGARNLGDSRGADTGGGGWRDEDMGQGGNYASGGGYSDSKGGYQDKGSSGKGGGYQDSKGGGYQGSQNGGWDSRGGAGCGDDSWQQGYGINDSGWDGYGDGADYYQDDKGRRDYGKSQSQTPKGGKKGGGKDDKGGKGGKSGGGGGGKSGGGGGGKGGGRDDGDDWAALGRLRAAA